MRHSSKLTCAIIATVATGVLVTPALAAKLNWNETYKNTAGSVLNFRVTSLTVTATRWTAHVSFANLSKTTTVQVGDTFGIAFFANAKTEDLRRASGLVRATAFYPARPQTLKPGATWSGVITGTGQLSTKATSGYARILFGPFLDVPGQKGTTYWITDHETHVPATSLAGTSGLVA